MFGLFFTKAAQVTGLLAGYGLRHTALS